MDVVNADEFGVSSGNERVRQATELRGRDKRALIQCIAALAPREDRNTFHEYSGSKPV